MVIVNALNSLEVAIVMNVHGNTSDFYWFNYIEFEFPAATLANFLNVNHAGSVSTTGTRSFKS